LANRILSVWPGGISGFPKLIPKLTGNALNKPYDAYHPVGTCRMGMDSESVVDLNLKVWGTENLWVLSTAVLPSAGDANPTFTLLCLAHSLACSMKS
jgi:choline dehydrogenase-like flavoprotein